MLFQAKRSRSGRTPPPSVKDPAVLPSLFGEGYGLYAIHNGPFLLSLLAHVLAIALLLASSSYLVTHRREVRRQIMQIATDVSPYFLPPSKSNAGGGGGGGDRDKLAASKGGLPQLSRQPLAPPAVIIRNENPRLPVEPTVIIPPEIHLPSAQHWPIGDPLSSIVAPSSNGTGWEAGIGAGSGGGVGSGSGPGVGPGSGGGIGGGVYRIGGGVTAPRVIYAPDPEFRRKHAKPSTRAWWFSGPS